MIDLPVMLVCFFLSREHLLIALTTQAMALIYCHCHRNCNYNRNYNDNHNDNHNCSDHDNHNCNDSDNDNGNDNCNCFIN